MRLLSSIDPAFHARALGLATEMVATPRSKPAGHGSATAPKAGEGWPRLRLALPRTIVPSGHVVLSPHLAIGVAPQRPARRHRTGAAVAVAESTNVEPRFGSVLGTLSVLRSNALEPGLPRCGPSPEPSRLHHRVGHLVRLSNHSVLLWACFPLAVFSGRSGTNHDLLCHRPAGFTVTVVVLFNIIQPTDGRSGSPGSKTSPSAAPSASLSAFCSGPVAPPRN